MVKILLVEDNEMNRDMLLRRLRRRGYEVSVAEDGAECIEQVKADRPQLILMDMSLPVMDGYQATRILKEGTGTSSIPILGLSAHAMTGDADRALEAGCDDYDTKPIDLKRLLRKMEALLADQPIAVAEATVEPVRPARPATPRARADGEAEAGTAAEPSPRLPPLPPLPPLPTLPTLPPLPRPPSSAASAPASSEESREEASRQEPHPTVPLPADALRAAQDSLPRPPAGLGHDGRRSAPDPTPEEDEDASGTE